HVDGMDREGFKSDLRTQRAAELLIIIIGEAASQVSTTTRDRLPTLPWPQIVRMRNRLVHHYFKVDVDLVWDVVSSDLPVLIAAVESFLAEEDHERSDRPRGNGTA